MGVIQALNICKRNFLYEIHAICNDYVPINTTCETFSHWPVFLSEMILHFWEFTFLVICGVQNMKVNVSNTMWFII